MLTTIQNDAPEWVTAVQTKTNRNKPLCTICGKYEIDQPKALHTKCLRCWNLFRAVDNYPANEIHRDMLAWDVPLKGKKVITNSGFYLTQSSYGRPRRDTKPGDKRLGDQQQ